MDVSTLTLRAARDAMRRKDFSSVELVQAVLDAIAARDAGIGAYLSVDAEGALAAARAADARRAEGASGDLLGIPLAIKDLFNVAGQPCTCASRILEGYIAPYDATVVARVKAAGAIPTGRTNMDEFAMGTTTEFSAFQKTRNPAAPDCVPGGSSGGSAAAVAGGMAIASLASDTGGSIRQPASFCGCVGVKPTYGLVSRFGVSGFASSLDQVGPMTKTVEDAAILLQAITGHDPRDQTTSRAPVPDYAASLDGASLQGLRIGVPGEYFIDGMDPEVEAQVRAAIDRCAKAGADVREISLPHAGYAVAVYHVCSTGEGSANLARFDGVRFGRRRGDPAGGLKEMYDRTRTEGLGPEVKRRVILGTFVLSSGHYNDYYARALKARTLIRRDYEAAFAACDLMMAPVAPTPAFPLGYTGDDPLKTYMSDIFTVSTNLAGTCAMSIPCGKTSAGLPVGLQILGPAFGEVAMFRAAKSVEELLSA
ncbi:MAG: Asp-tRNA(Asn)/Glu-tRNA(Gln) amidotransferase subunit GatA [Kiritimatiellia bacterium]